MKWHKMVNMAGVGAALLGGAMVLSAGAANVVSTTLVDGAPGSVLIFLSLDISSGASTQIRITDISGGAGNGPCASQNPSNPCEPDGFTTSHKVRLNFGCRASKGSCADVNTEEPFTSHQTRVFDLVNDLGLDTNFPCLDGQGFAIAFIEDANGNLVSDDKLIGSYVVTTADGTVASNAIAVQHNQLANGVLLGSPTPGIGPRVNFSTAAAGGSDYVGLPTVLHGDFRADANTEIILLNLEDVSRTVQLYAWNQHEKIFSKQHTFRCWERRHIGGDDPFVTAANATDNQDGFIDSRLQTGNSLWGSDVYGSLKVYTVDTATGLPASSLIGALRELNDGVPSLRNLFHSTSGFPSVIVQVE